MPISVIIPVRNEGDRIALAVRSIVDGRSCSFPLEVVIVDDASTDGSCDNLEEVIEGTPETSLVVRRLDSWSGIPFARNRGAEAAKHPICFITDGNTRFPRNWDLPIWQHFASGRILAATILDMGSSFRGFGCQLMLPSMGVTWIAVPHAYGGYVPISACTGTVIDRHLFHQLGGYDETLPLYGAAEPEFSVRAWLSGSEIVNTPELAIYHRFRPRTAHDQLLASIGKLFRRNYLRFACYYLPEAMLRETYEYYRRLSSEEFESFTAELTIGHIWARRAHLQRSLPRDFSWFANRFFLTGLYK